MKRLIALALCALVAAPAMAAQQNITTVSSATASREALRTALNLRLTDIDENFDELYAAIGTRPWVAQETAPADTTLLWFDTDQVADTVVLKIYTGGAWVAHAIGTGGGDYTLPAATASALGGVIDGAGVTIAGDGTLSADLQAVGDCTAAPCLDGSADGGNMIKLWAGTGSYWTALQGGAPAANRSWRLPILAPPSAGETNVMTMDEYGQMAFLDKPSTSGYVLSSTDAGVLSWAAPATAGGDDLGDATYSTVVGLWTTCSGYLKSDGTCDTPAGYTNLTSFVTQTNWRVFYSNGSGDVTELALGADGTYLKSNGASAAPTWATPSGTMVYPGAGIPNSTGSAWGTSYSLDTDLSTTSASDDTIPSAKATKALVDGLPTLAAGTGITITEDGGGAGIDTVNVTTNTYQAYDADLTTWAGITPGSGVGTFLATPSSANLASAVTGETGSGALVFDTSPVFSTSVALPQGTGPTVDAAGETAIDTTSDQFIYYGGAKRVLTYKKQIDFAVKTPVDADDFLLFKAQTAMTITDIHVIAQGGTSISVDIQECNSSGASCATVDAAITADTDGAEDDGTLSNGTIDAGDWVKVVLGAPSGTVNYLAGSIYYVETAN